MTTGSDNLIELHQAGVDFGSTRVLTAVDLTVEGAAVVGVLGPNGSGKTTLLRLLATLLRPVRGGGTVLGATLATREVDAIRPAIGLIGHEAALYPELTLAENLEFVCRIRDLPRQKARQALLNVGLAKAADRKAAAASSGMLRRVEFARVWMTKPRLLLLDEPEAGLDETAAPLVSATVESVTKRGGAVVLASHQTGPLFDLADRVYEMGEGSLTMLTVAGT